MSFFYNLISNLCSCMPGSASEHNNNNNPNERTPLITQPPANRPAIPSFLKPKNALQELSHEVVNTLLIDGDENALIQAELQVTSPNAAGTPWAEELAVNIIKDMALSLQIGCSVHDDFWPYYEESFTLSRDKWFGLEAHCQIHQLVVTLSMMIIMAPGIIEAIGLTVDGVREGSWYSTWQAQYGGVLEQYCLTPFLWQYAALYREIPDKACAGAREADDWARWKSIKQSSFFHDKYLDDDARRNFTCYFTNLDVALPRKKRSGL